MSDTAATDVRARGVLLVGTPDDTDDVVRALREHGVQVRATDPSDGAGPVERALDELGDLLPVACGGDGTVHHLVRQLHVRGLLEDRPVGLVRRGTADDLAGALGLPHETGRATDVLLAGRSRTLDLLRVDDGDVVVNVDHVGLGAHAARRGTALKPWLRAAAYPAGALAVAGRGRHWHVRLEVDGRVVHDGEAALVAVGNGHRVGGGAPLLPGAQPDDGLADVLVAAPDSLRRRLALLRALRHGEHVAEPDVVTLSGQRVTLQSDPPVDVDVDGELLDPVAERGWTVAPGAWRVLVP